MIDSGCSFEELTKNIGLPRDQHEPEWFQKCLPIDDGFQFSQMGLLILVAPDDIERAQTPLGTFYLFDGIHRTLVLAKQLLLNKVEFQPVEALYLVPRRN